MCTDTPLRAVLDEYISLGKAHLRKNKKSKEAAELDLQIAKVGHVEHASVALNS